MKTQVVHSTPTTLGPFLRLILQVTTQYEAGMAEDPQSPVGGAPDLGRTPASDEGQMPKAEHYVFTRATTLGPFLTLLLTLHNRSSWIERDWWQSSTAPRGTILAARYVAK